jgi:hypothetical protein
MRLRQIVLAARDLEKVVADLCAVLDVEVAFRDPGVGAFGLQNAVMPIGDTFLEVVSPVTADAPAARYLDRRGSDCGYMLMVQTDDFRADRARLERLGVRVVWSAELDDICGMHLHPRDTGGTLLSLDQPVPADSWRWAGPQWRQHVRTGLASRVVGAEIASLEPGSLAGRWSEVLGRPSKRQADDAYAIDVDEGRVLFSRASNDRTEGLQAFDVLARQREKILSEARRRGLSVADHTVMICGTEIRLVAA